MSNVFGSQNAGERSTSLLGISFEFAELRVGGIRHSGVLDSGGCLLSPLKTDLDEQEAIGLAYSGEGGLGLFQSNSNFLSTALESSRDPAGDCGTTQERAISGLAGSRNLVGDLLIGVGLRNLQQLGPDEQGRKGQEMLLVTLVSGGGGASCTLVGIVSNTSTFRGG